MRDDIVKYRIELMGIATILITLGHTVFYGQGYVNYGLLQNFLIFGYSGVDIFLFLSGFGLTFSIRKNTRQEFYKNRINRLLPTCIIIYLLFLAFNIRSFSFSTLFVPFQWLVIGGYWYIGFIVICYFLFPFLYGIINKENANASLLLLFLILFSLILLQFLDNPQLLALRNGIGRIPIFIMGIIYGCKKWIILEDYRIIVLSIGLGITALLYCLNYSSNVYSDTYSYIGIFLLTIPFLNLSGKCLRLSGGVNY